MSQVGTNRIPRRIATACLVVIGGGLTISSEPGHGTIVAGRVPVEGVSP